MHEELPGVDNCIWRPYNFEGGELLEVSAKMEPGVCNKEMIVFGHEAELLERLGYKVDEWLKAFAVEIDSR